MIKAAIIQHEDSTPPGTTLNWLSQRGLPFEIFRVYEDGKLPKVENFDLFFICGGSMNVDQENTIPWLKSEKELLQRALQSHKMMVGLCLGAQLLAEALGAEVSRHSVTELGWQKVQFNHDNFFKLGADLAVFQWHSYTFEIPAGARRLASNAACKNQAFVYGKNVLGFQFHPESTKEWVVECAQSANLPVGPYCQSQDEMIKSLPLQLPLEKWYLEVLDQHFINWKNAAPFQEK